MQHCGAQRIVVRLWFVLLVLLGAAPASLHAEEP